jgi:hypothetical protein
MSGLSCEELVQAAGSLLTRNSVLLVWKEMTTFVISLGELRRNLAEQWTWEFLGHWKDPGSNKQDIGEKMKRTPDRRSWKLRIDRVPKLAIVRVRYPTEKSIGSDRGIERNSQKIVNDLTERVKTWSDLWIWHSNHWMTLCKKTSKDSCNFFIFQDISALILIEKFTEYRGNP